MKRMLVATVIAVIAVSTMAVQAGGAVRDEAVCATNVKLTVPDAARWGLAKKAFAADWGLVRGYLINPTKVNRVKMQRVVNTSLFRGYLDAARVLHAKDGKVRGRFSWTFTADSQCYDPVSTVLSFKTDFRGYFPSTNGTKMDFTEPAYIEMKGSRIMLYRRVPV